MVLIPGASVSVSLLEDYNTALTAGIVFGNTEGWGAERKRG